MKPTIASLALNGLLLASLGTVSAPAKVTAQDAAQGAPADKPPAEKVVDNRPEIKSSITEHTITIAGQSVSYRAEAGKMPLKDDAGKLKAEVFFVAYTRTGVPAQNRPVTFCFNGGPGSSSVWLHLGMLGPKRIRFPDDAKPLTPPYALEENPWSLLDVTDLVFIDPVSTGYSRPAEGEGKEQFHGFEEDVRSVGQCIYDWTSRNQRWASAKLLLGESYGGIRAAGLAGHLQDRYFMELNGIVVVSGAINFQTLRFGPGNDLPNIAFLPTYTATAWYHKALAPQLLAMPVAEVVKRAEAFAKGPYASALFQGTSLSAETANQIADELALLTGLSKDFVTKANLRIDMDRFAKELLRPRSRTVGRYDSRYQGIDRDDAGDGYEYDASGAAIFGPFTATFNDYVRSELKYQDDRVYEILTGNVQPWSYKRFEGRFVDATETLRKAMTQNPFLKVFLACGYYDLATPHFAMMHTADHLQLDESLRGNVNFGFYEGGHMMYVHQPSLERLRSDLLKFYETAVPKR